MEFDLKVENINIMKTMHLAFVYDTTTILYDLSENINVNKSPVFSSESISND